MKRITKELEKEFTKAKQYVYSWLTDGEGDTTYAISDKLSNLNIDFGANLTAAAEAGIPVPATPEAVNFVHGNTKNSYAKTIAAGYLQVEKKVAGEQDLDKEYTFSAPKALNVVGVDAGNIYGGVVITTNCKCTSINYSSASRYENVNGIVAGDRDILIEDVKAKGVYGGGAGYGSVLDGNVSISLVGTNNSITNVFGGGQKGAVVTGDVSIDVSRRDAKGGRIGTIYGGGEDAIVKGDVTITIHGTNAVGIGTVSGSGKGKKSEVMGDRYLIIDGFSGKFTTTIKDFDHITLTSGTAITLTQSQQKSIQSATYEFVVDDATLKQTNAMLTWNKNINVGQIYITLDSDFASNVTDVFQTAIFSSTYLTQQTYEVWNQGLQIRDEDGNVVKGYTTEFVADVDSKGKAKKKGGTIVLKFEGTNADITDEDVGKREFSAANDDVNIRGEYVAASVATMGGDDTVTVQKNTVMAGNIDTGTGNDAVNVQTGAIVTGDIALGEGENALRVLGDGEVVGSIIVDKNSKNVIDVNGTISQIEGGDSTTENIVTLRKKDAVGYYEYNNGILGKNGAFDIGLAGEVLSGEIKFGEYRGDFIKQDLDFTNSDGSNDTVLVTQASEWDGNINFGKGKDTLVLNTPATANGPASHGTITAEDGDDVIVANQTGVTVDADKLKLSGTDNILVVSNGVRATIKGMAIGDFETDYGKFSGLFLGQNAILDDGGDAKGENKKYAVESFDGNLTLQGDLTVLSPKDYTNPESDNYSQELADRIGTYYTVGNGVNGVINANGKKINLNKGATVTGEINGLNGATITLLEGSAINGTVVGKADIYFKQNAGSEDFLFENDGAANAAQIRVAKNVVATVGSINGIAGTTFQGTDDFENDSAKVTLNEDAALYAAQDKNLLVGKITKDTDFAEKYGDMAKGTISVIDEVKARVTFTDAKVYLGNGKDKGKLKVAFHKGITFKGANTIDVQSDGVVIDDKQLFFDGDATVAFNVLDGAELVFDGIEKGAKISDKVSINLAKNARLAYGDNMETGSWSEEFNASKLDEGKRTNITFREGSLVDNKIMLKDADKNLVVNIEKDSFVKGDLTVEDKGVIMLGKGEDTLNVAAATVDGVINTREADFGAAAKKDVINLAGSTVNGMAAPHEEVAVALDANDQLFMTDKATVNGDITGGGLVHITDSEVTGSIEATKNVLVGATVATVKNGDTFVESGKDASGTESTIGLVDATANDVAVFADDAKATIGKEGEELAAIAGKKGNGKKIELYARNGGTIALKGVDAEVANITFGAIHNGSAIDFGGDVKLVADQAEFGIEDGGELKNLGKVEVSGGIVDADLRKLTGNLAAAGKASLWSKDGADITAKDVTFVAKESEINIDSEGSKNSFGKIVQTGKVDKEGYKRTTGAELADKATVAVTKAETFDADSIDQVAKEATVAVGFDAAGIVEGSAITTKIAGDVAQNGETAMAAFSGDTTITGGIVQDATKTATVLGDGTTNVGTDIVQSAGTVANAAFGGKTDITGSIKQTATTAAALMIQGDAKAKGIEQISDVAWTVVDGTAGIADGIVQKNVNDKGEDIAAKEAVVKVAGTLAGNVTQKAKGATVKIDGTFSGSVDQAAETAAVEFEKIAFDEENKVTAGQTGIVGDVTQIGTTSAKIEDMLVFEQKYTMPEPDEKFPEELADKTIKGSITRQVGAVTQESAENVLSLGATITADGTYETTADPKINDYHKRAVVDFGNVELKAGDIKQKGVNTEGKRASNVVKADIAYTAEGESNVKVGNTTLELGSITQYSNVGQNVQGNLNPADDLYANEISLTATQTIDAGKEGDQRQSAMELGTFTGKVGAIDQTAYKASNKVVIDMEKNAAENLTVGEIGMTVDGDINMRAYGDDANNTLDLAGEVTVKGDVKVGGVIDGEAISEDSAWGDRTANKNTVTIATDTVTLEKDLTLVGMTNKLTLDNDSYFTKGDTELKQVAKNVALAGKDNTIEVAAGLKLDNIALYDLTDHDKIGGLEGYDLTDDKVYNNTIKLYGAANSLELKQKNSNDTIEIRGGNVARDVVTNNGNDSILLGNTDKEIDGAKRVMGDATIGGKVVMGTKDEAVGSNKIDMQAFAARDLANPDADVLHNVAIGKSVEMYAGAKDHTGDAKFKFDNELVMAGAVAPNPAEDIITVKGERSFATATIGGGVTMVAENAYDAVTGELDKTVGTNKISMGKLTQIDGDVTMTGYTSNDIAVVASEELDFGKTIINGYAEITGKVAMTAKKNTISVAGDAAQPIPLGAAAYMNGITMGNKYTDADGKEYLIEDSTNKISVGASKNYVGSELIVGTWDEDDGENKRSVADVKMGTVAFKKGDSELVWTLESVDKAAKGHDIIKYFGEQTALVTGLTRENTIDVTGRFDSSDIVMMAEKNHIYVRGDGELSKFDNSMKTAEEKNKVSEEVRTASFDAGDIVQVAGLAGDSVNSIVAHGNKNGVERYGYLLDEDGNVTEKFGVIAHLPNLTFKAGKITQVQYATQLDDDKFTLSNLVDLTGHIVAETGDITQQANVDNKITVEAFAVPATDNQPIAAPRSTVGKIDQIAGANNTVTLTRTDGKTIGQIAGNDNTVTMTDSTSGAITQDAVKNNTANIVRSTSGAITQVAVEGSNKVNGMGAWEQADFAVDPETGKKTVEAPIYNPSVIDGNITQTAAIKNDVITTLTDINGAITQDGGLNNVNVQGAVKDVKFVEDDGTEGAFKQQVAVKLGGDITQKNADINKISLAEVAFGHNVDQSAKFANSFVASATATDAAENVGVSPDDAMCEYHNTKTHASSTVEVGAKFNTMDVGTVTQKVELAAADVEEGAMAYVGANLAVTDNVNVGDITQENNFATNTILVNQTTFNGKVTERAQYVGEIDNSLAYVNYVGPFELNKVTEVGAIEQTGTANTATLKGIEGSTITQAAVAAEVIEGVAGGNKLTVTAVDDVNAVVVDTAEWIPEKPGFNKEVFKKAILDGSANVRAGNTLGAITQTTAATGNYEAAKQVKNEIDLTNTTVNGDVSQTAVNKNANLKNEFTATTTRQHFVDIGKNADGELVAIAGGYDRTTKDSVNGAITQSGYENEANVANVDVTGNVTQTTELIDKTGHHGDQFTGTAIGGNTLNVNKDAAYVAKDAAYVAKDAAVAETDLVAAGVEKIEEKLNIVDVAVGGKIVQAVNNKDGKTEDADGKKFIADLTADNAINVTLANMGEIEQTTTYGTNTIDIDSGALTDKPQQLLKVGNITQTGSANTVDAQTTEIPVIKQDAIAQEALAGNIRNRAHLVGSKSELVREDGHAGTVDDPEVIVQQPLAEYAKAESITQTVKQLANEALVEGKKLYDVANKVDGEENSVDADYATIGDITQGGEGLIDNKIEFDGNARDVYEIVEDEVADTATAQIKETIKDNTLGNVSQTGVNNDADIDVAAKVGNIVQTANSVDTVKTTQTDPDLIQEVSKEEFVSNKVEFEDVDLAGTITQTATSDKFTTVTYKNGEEDVSVLAVDDEVKASNEATLTKTNTGDVTQTINGSAGVGNNKITADQSNLGDVDQNAIDGTNELSLTTETPLANAKPDKVESKKVGTINQDGVQNTVMAGEYGSLDLTKLVKAGDVETGAIVQNAIGVKASDGVKDGRDIMNDVVMAGVNVDAVATLKEGEDIDPTKVDSWELTQATVAKAKAESVTQTAQTIKAQGEFIEAIGAQDKFYDNAIAPKDHIVNGVMLMSADAGFVNQTSVDNVASNIVNFQGAAVQSKKIMTTVDEDGNIIAKLDADNKAQLVDDDTIAYPNEIGQIDQSGRANEALIQNAAVAGNMTQTSGTFATIDYSNAKYDEATETYVKVEDEAAKPLYTTGKYEGDIDNNIELTNVAVAGDVIQKANSEKFMVSEYDEVGADPVKTEFKYAKGYNTLTVTTKSDATHEFSTKIGTVTQTGIENSITAGQYDKDEKKKDEKKLVKAGDVTTGAIKQNANAVSTTDELKNSVQMSGVVINATNPVLTDPTAAYDAETNPYVFVEAHVAKAKAESIEQTVTAVEADTAMFDVELPQASNIVNLENVDAGTITQSGNANVANSVNFSGATIVTNKIVLDKDDEGVVTAAHLEATGEKEFPNVIGATDQTGVYNYVSANYGSFAQAEEGGQVDGITQTAQSFKTIDLSKWESDQIEVHSMYNANNLSNAVNLKSMAKVGDVTQEVKSEAFKIETIDGKVNGLPETKDGYVTGGNELKAETDIAKDYEIGAVKQTGGKYNRVDVAGFGSVAAPDELPKQKEGAEDLSDPESWEYVTQGRVASAKVASIEQSATVLALETLEDAEGNPVEYFDVLENAKAINKITLNAADAGAIVQTGNANTENTVTFTGEKAELKTVVHVTVTPGKPGEKKGHDDPEPGKDTYAFVDEKKKVNANTIDTIDQTGVANSAEINVGLSAGDITQDAVSNKTITEITDVRVQTKASEASEDEDIKKNGEFFKVIKTSVVDTISNEVVLSDVTTAGAINQTAAVEEKYNETTEVWRNHQLADGTDNWVLTTKEDYLANSAIKDLTGGEPLAENPFEGPDKHVNGTNKVTVKDGTNVEGKITQTASGDYGKIDESVYQNHVKAVGMYRQVEVKDPEEGEIRDDNPQVVEAGAYLNSIGDVEQTLTSYATEFSYNAETNFIELSQINAGALKQVANGYALNLITAYPGLVMEMEVDPTDGYAKDDGIAKVTIASTEQKGMYNTLRLTDVKIGAVQEDETFAAGDITLNATGIFKETEDGEDWAFGKNSVELTNVEVNDITMMTQQGTVTIDGKAYVTAAADTVATLESVTAHDVTTEEGNDTITLTGTTTITGTIDMGDNTWKITPKDSLDLTKGYDMLPGKDTLEILDDDVDLSKAEIKNAEVLKYGDFSWSGTHTLEAITIDAETIKGFSGADYKVQAQSISVKAVDGIDVLMGANAEDESGEAVLDTLNLEGNLLEDPSFGTYVKLVDFNEVTIGKDSQQNGEAVLWARTAGSSEKINFNITELNDSNKLVVGNFTDITATGLEKYTADSITITYDGKTYENVGGYDGVWQNSGDTKALFIYSSSSGALTYAYV